MDKLQLLETVLGQSHKANRDYVQFHCPFCNHRKPKLGISLNSGGWKCWVCPAKGRSIVQLLKKVQSNKTNIELAQQLWKEKVQFQIQEQQQLELPKEFKPLWIPNERDLFFKKAKNYLLSRGLTENDIKKHRIGYCDQGRYSDMIIMPSFNEFNQLNFFTARSYINKTFLIPPNIDKTKVIFDESLINWNEPVIIVESKLDAITVKRNVIPLNGKQITKELARKLIEERPPKLIFCLDGDALKDCLRLSEFFKNYGIECFKVNLPITEDPNSLGFEQIWKLISNAERINESSLFEFNIKERLGI